MKSINLDEETELIKSVMGYPTGYVAEYATKRDILRSAIPLLKELYKDYAGEDVEPFFIDWLEALVKKGDTHE